MSKINDLIKELCPNGVEFYKLSDIGYQFNGLSGKSKKDFENGNYKYITYTNIYNNPSIKLDINDYVFVDKTEKQNKLKFKDVLIAGSSENIEDSGMISVVTEEPKENIYLNSFCFGLRLNDKFYNRYNPLFLKHVFRSNSFRDEVTSCSFGVTRYNLSKSKFLKIKIPCPPLEVQEEIVQILDKFGELEAELESELEARRSQYEFWRKNIFELNNEDFKSYELQEIFDMKNGYTPSTLNNEFWDNGKIPWFRMEDIRLNGGVLNDSIQHITPASLKNSGTFKANSIICATSATIGVHALIECDFLSNQRFTCLTLKEEFKDEIYMKYIYYYCFILDEYCKNNLNQGSFSSVDMNMFKKFKFKIPSIEVQKKIINILDKFDKLVNDISVGLPAEIESRRKQYEYYRNKLLSFEEQEYE